ncbi:hypothetical protein MHZ92_10885 [Sporosarcina sp. ACRSL]|uniref:hypothetical protein n=1 Tax=Sporosarcina sp. ACRSL TaxID=2918215 RepID=UPI001EF6796F|nr:hypothetical protein [Sporosarcina sp. ACRSL]MCG7344644.1 hypothetical protein [Sporosarcina sp. ACRSL]
MKKLSIMMSILFLAACSVETITDERAKSVVEVSGKEVLRQPEGAEEQEYIKISKEDAPKLWNDADVQLWKYVTDYSLSEAMGYKQEITNWRKFEDEFDKSLSSPNQTWENPGKLLLAFMTDVEVSNFLGQGIWEVNSRIKFLDENNALGYIMSYGFFDDSTAGSDIKLKMKKENGFWYIESAEEREQCSRGIGEKSGFCL